jgi:hypothetical protein
MEFLSILEFESSCRSNIESDRWYNLGLLLAKGPICTVIGSVRIVWYFGGSEEKRNSPVSPSILQIKKFFTLVIAYKELL